MGWAEYGLVTERNPASELLQLLSPFSASPHASHDTDQHRLSSWWRACRPSSSSRRRGRPGRRRQMRHLITVAELGALAFPVREAGTDHAPEDEAAKNWAMDRPARRHGKDFLEIAAKHIDRSHGSVRATISIVVCSLAALA